MSLPQFYADRVLDKLGIDRPEDLELLEVIAWERGALVREDKLDGAEARLTVMGGRAIITLSTAVQDPHRRRFNIAHELGHLEMHRSRANLAICTSQDLNQWDHRDKNKAIELQANEFAASFLLPERFFASLCQVESPSLDFIGQLANKFNVSLTATALRYLLFCGEPCAVVFSQNNRICWFRGSREFEKLDLFVDVRSRLDRSSLAAPFFQGQAIRQTQKSVPALAWLRSGRYRDEATIKEQSWPMPGYNAVLTLLWVDDEIEADDDDND